MRSTLQAEARELICGHRERRIAIRPGSCVDEVLDKADAEYWRLPAAERLRCLLAEVADLSARPSPEIVGRISYRATVALEEIDP